MSKINILDCTLRDGGYVNDWNFGEKVINSIVENVTMAGVDFVECGFWSEKKDSTKEKSIFKTVAEAEDYFDNVDRDSLVLMVNCGEIDTENVAPYAGGKIRTIRVAFHKNQLNDAQELCLKLQQSGYVVFFQPMVTMRYTDEELLKLIKWTNKNKPDAFYIVDSFGTMRKKDILRMFFLVDNNLDADIKVGFHSHNNLQLSFSNAQELIILNSKRELIIDTSIFGMGRGAGNLCTELMLQYINENIGKRYNIMPILESIDQDIMPIFKTHFWGYSVPYYVAAVNDCHPNYATYLSNMQTLLIQDINAIMKMIAFEKKYEFDKEYIARLYSEYQQHLIDDTDAIENIRVLCDGHSVLVLAPGKSINLYKSNILRHIENEHPIIISVNHISDIIESDRIFVGNLRRFKEIENELMDWKDKAICTSNVVCDGIDTIVNYSSYLVEEVSASDNSGIMLLNILRKAGVKKIFLAGYDGFEDNQFNNYYSDSMANIINVTDIEKVKETNASVATFIKGLRAHIDIEFLTPSLYE